MFIILMNEGKWLAAREIQNQGIYWFGGRFRWQAKPLGNWLGKIGLKKRRLPEPKKKHLTYLEASHYEYLCENKWRNKNWNYSGGIRI
jgi:hypothetical protein